MDTMEDVRAEAAYRYRKSPEGKLWDRIGSVGVVMWAVLAFAVAAAMAVPYADEGGYGFTQEDGTSVVAEVMPGGYLLLDDVDIKPELSPVAPGPQIPRWLIMGEAVAVGLSLIVLVAAPITIDRRKRRQYTDELVAAWARDGNRMPPKDEESD